MPLRPKHILCGRFFRKLPTRKNENSWMDLQGSGQHFRTFDAQLDTIILDCRNGRLGNTGQPRNLMESQKARIVEICP